MLKAVEAFYHDGILELKEKPQGIDHARAIVTFIEEGNGPFSTQDQTRARDALINQQKMLADIPPERSLVDELLNERRLEARDE